MAAVLQLDPLDAELDRYAPATRRAGRPLRAVPSSFPHEPGEYPILTGRRSRPADRHRQARPRPARRPAPAVYRRRRLMAALVGLGLVLTVARAAAAFGESNPLATPERLPHVQAQTVVVQPGDTLWSVARRLAPGSDPRKVVDALVRARGGDAVVRPGDTIRWTGS